MPIATPRSGSGVEQSPLLDKAETLARDVRPRCLGVEQHQSLVVEASDTLAEVPSVAMAELAAEFFKVEAGVSTGPVQEHEDTVAKG
jgi:hypothetical protein